MGEDPEEMDDTSGDNENPDGNTSGGGGEPAENSSEGDGGDETDGGEASPEIVEHELVVSEGQFSTDAYVEAVVENTGDARSGNITLTVDWYDADGNYLDNGQAWLVSLGAGETWEAHVHHLGSDSQNVDDYDIEGEFVERSGEEPDHLEPNDIELNVGDDEAVVSGTIENTGNSTEGYVAAIAKFYDQDGVVLGDNFTNVTDLPAGESWAFEVTWRGRDRTSRVDDFELLVANTT